jgi:gamma-glutamylputrescine oxidase
MVGLCSGPPRLLSGSGLSFSFLLFSVDSVPSVHSVLILSCGLRQSQIASLPHPTFTMRRQSHPWGAPPWTIAFRPKSRPLPVHVDFAIIGAGFTGLSAAAHLAKLAPGKSVLVLESASLGNGASGRTGGMALAETAAGPLPGLGDVLAAYKKILRNLKIDSRLHLPGAHELGRSHTRKDSPISWSDSGNLRIVRKVPGGTVDPGKVLSGLARAAQIAGAQILEHAEVLSINSPAKRNTRDSSASPNDKDSLSPLRLRIRLKFRGRLQQKTLLANQVLLATNAASLPLSGLRKIAEPKLTFALATAPLTRPQLRSIGLSSRRPFYTIDFPYLWGRLLENNGVIFGAGLVPLPASASSPFSRRFSAPNSKLGFRDLLRFHIRSGESAGRLAWLESRIRNMHPALKKIRVTHRWGGPILLTKDFRPVFRRHPRHKNVLVLAGFSGHGVALSVYLGHWAAQSLLGHRPLPTWPHT